MWRDVRSDDQLLVAIARVLDGRLSAPQLGEPLLLAVLRGQVGQALEGRGIGRLEGDERFEGRSLGLAVATSRRHPGPQLEQAGLRTARPRQMGRRPHDFVGPVRGLRPSSRALQTARSSGRARSQRVSHSSASSKCPTRVARSARASHTRSSSGAAFLALASDRVISSTG